MKKFGIRQTVAALTLFPLLVIVVSVELYFLHARFSDMDQDLQQRGKLIAYQLASISEYGVFSNNQVFLQNVAQSTLQQGDVRSVSIQNNRLETLVNTDSTNSLGGVPERKLDSLTPIIIGKDSLWIYQPIIPAQVALNDDETLTGHR